LAKDRLSESPDGRVALRLKTPWHDGTHTLAFNPLDFLAKLAVLVPWPHKNIIVYHGVLSPHARLRQRVIAYGREPLAAEPVDGATAAPKHKRRQWSELMRRAFGYDLLDCSQCGGKMVLLACITQRAVIAKVLRHLGLPSEPPRPAQARASPRSQSQLDHIA
jgi:hypothetical protein